MKSKIHELLKLNTYEKELLNTYNFLLEEQNVNVNSNNEQVFYRNKELKNHLELDKKNLLASYSADFWVTEGLLNLLVECKFSSAFDIYSTSNILTHEKFPYPKSVFKFKDVLTKDELIKTSEAIQELCFFETENFLFIPDYTEFKNDDVFNKIPNLYFKPLNYRIRFEKGIGRSYFENKSIRGSQFKSLKEFFLKDIADIEYSDSLNKIYSPKVPLDRITTYSLSASDYKLYKTKLSELDVDEDSKVMIENLLRIAWYNIFE